MNITKSSVVGALLSLSLVAACGRDDNNNNNNHVDAGGGGDTGSGSAGGMTVKDVQADALASNSPVELHGVIVTAIDNYGNTVGDLWVQDVDGGARSGVHVYHAEASDVAKLKVGDIVDIKSAIKYEFKSGTGSLTEIEAPKGGKMSITSTGTGTVPAPHVLDAVAIAAMAPADRTTFMEDWEGVPVTLQNARPSNFGTFSDGADDQHSFDVGSVVTVESNMVALPASAAVETTCYASITGIVDYVVGKYTLLPYNANAFVDGGLNCAAVTQFVPATVAELQAGTKTGSVKLTGVYVMAWSVSAGVAGKTLWVSDSLLATKGAGVEVFSANGVDDTIRVLGTKVDVQGQVAEFDLKAGGNAVTEFLSGMSTVKLNAAAAGPPTPLQATVPQVSDIGETSDSEAYEGTLVTLSNVLVTAVSAGTSNQVTITDNNNKSVTMDDDVVFKFGGTVPVKGTCYSSITGVMDVDTTNDVRTFNPRSVADMTAGVAGTDCTATLP